MSLPIVPGLRQVQSDSANFELCPGSDNGIASASPQVSNKSPARREVAFEDARSRGTRIMSLRVSLYYLVADYCFLMYSVLGRRPVGKRAGVRLEDPMQPRQTLWHATPKAIAGREKG